MGHPVAVVLALLVGLAAAYCLARCVVPRWRGEHGVAVDAWHVAMGTAMVAMLVAPVGRSSAARAGRRLRAGRAVVCLPPARPQRSGAHARLGAACAVMAVMLMPAVVAAPASAATAMPQHHHVPGMDMSGMDMSIDLGADRPRRHVDAACHRPGWRS